jgi:hypothetical protein
MVIFHRVEGSFSFWESALFLVPYVYVMWVITCMQVMLNSVCSHVYFCGAVNSCGEIVMYVVYVVSCVRISLITNRTIEQEWPQCPITGRSDIATQDTTYTTYVTISPQLFKTPQREIIVNMDPY